MCASAVAVDEGERLDAAAHARRRIDEQDVDARLLHLVGNGQPGQAGTDDDDRGVLPRCHCRGLRSAAALSSLLMIPARTRLEGKSRHQQVREPKPPLHVVSFSIGIARRNSIGHAREGAIGNANRGL